MVIFWYENHETIKIGISEMLKLVSGPNKIENLLLCSQKLK